jgi:glycosyltransferase involved in cell wall biosynthesis
MKIAWFTPFHKASAIGRFSRYVTAELAKSADVDIWHPPADEVHPTSLRTIVCPEMPLNPENLAQYDLCVYNLGDHLGFHGRILETSSRVPGIVVLHDFVMHHLFACYYLTDQGDPQAYIDVMTRTYGEAGRDVADGAVSGKMKGVWETDRVIEFPLFEPAIRGAFGVIVHSEFFRDAVAKLFFGPVQRLFLAYDTRLPGRAPLTRADLAVPKDRLLVVTVGHANSNKRILEVIEAIAGDRELSKTLVYAILGPAEGSYCDLLRNAVRKHRLEETVRLVGYVSDEVLSSYLVHSDVCVNLRYPAMEGASASAVEEMLYGKPVIVTNSGFYRELPSDAVYKIDPGSEIEGIRQALRQLASKPEIRKRIGAAARRFAEEEAQASRYATGFLQFANEIMDGAPILKFADRMAFHLSGMGVTADMPLLTTVAATAHELFCANGRELKPLPE